MPRTRGTALVVDPDPVARLALDRQLDALEWDAYLVNSGFEAVRLLETRMRFELLLIDMRLTELERRAIVDAAAYLHPPARTLFMSAEPSRSVAGRERVLIKPFSTPALQAAIYPR